MLSQTTEYALRAIVWLAAQGGAAKTTEEVAQATRVPTGYLSKVLQALARAKFVRSQSGPRGGFKLVRAPAELTVLDVVNAIDPVQRIKRCPLGLENHGTRLCPLHRNLDAARALVEDAFRRCTIAALLADNGGSPPFCVGAPA